MCSLRGPFEVQDCGNSLSCSMPQAGLLEKGQDMRCAF